MSIPLDLLAATESRGVGIGIYGGPGLKKTHGIAYLPPPILMLDIGEGGTGSLLPWIHRRRDSSASKWTVYSQAQREVFLSLLDEDTMNSLRMDPDDKKSPIGLKPAPYVDVVHFDNTRYESYEDMVTLIANFDLNYYNSLALDSLQEFSVQTQTKAKGAGNYDALMTSIAFSWAQAQERAGMGLRKLRNYRDKGVFIYLTGSETIAKDYVRNPMEKRPSGEPAPEAYSVKGTVDLPGALAGAICHIPDILCRAKMMNGRAVWQTEPEMLPGGGAYWDGKDRFGRLPKYIYPNFRTICAKLYGTEGYRAIYSYALARVEEIMSSATA